ncbi:MAG: roadblock/LC7 domain-containing protein [Candidatus Methanofastidiosum sp.]|nr:roadblock/LC7 domain-containing protein [Methanofastidiosum sp.]
MREDILIKHLKNLTFANKEIKDAFLMDVDGLLIAVLDKNRDKQDIAARMAGVIDAAKRIENKLPDAISVITNENSIVAIPLSEKFLLVVLGTNGLNIHNLRKLVDKNKDNILSMIEKREFNDLYTFNPTEIKGLDI